MGWYLITETVQGSFSDVQKTVEWIGQDCRRPEWWGCRVVRDCGRTFDNPRRAEEFLSLNAPRGDFALAAQVNHIQWKSQDAEKQYKISREKNLKASKKYQALVAKKDSLVKEIEKKLESIRAIKDAHAKYVKNKKRCECEKCGSAIPTNAIKFKSHLLDPVSYVVDCGSNNYFKTSGMPICPVCNNQGRRDDSLGVKPAVAKKMDALFQKIDVLAEKCRQVDADMCEIDKKLNTKIYTDATDTTTDWLLGFHYHE